MIDWGVIPTAGQGQRMAPASTAVPKTLLPVGLRPMLHWTLMEAAESGLKALAIVIAPGDVLVRAYIDAAHAAGRVLSTDTTGTSPPFLTAVRGAGANRKEAHPDHFDANALVDLGRLLADIEIHWVEQPRPTGIGDAFVRCRHLTGGSPFAVLLPDNWFDISTGDDSLPAIAQVYRGFELTGMCSLGLTWVDPGERALFGNVGGVELAAISKRTHRVLSLQNKETGAFGGDDRRVLRGCGRYVVDDRFYEALEATRGQPDGTASSGGAPSEWDDVPAFQRLIATAGLAGREIQGRHYDVGRPAGYLAAAAHLYEQLEGVARIP